MPGFTGGVGSSGNPPRHISSRIDQYLENGGSREANVDGSVTPVEFSWTAPRFCYIERMIIEIQDQGSVTSDSYGALTALPNGCDFEHVQADLTVTKVVPLPINTNLDWAGICYDFVESNFSGGGNTKGLVGRWTFRRDGIPLYLRVGDKLVLRVNDNLTGLDLHRYLVKGAFLESA